MKLSASKLLFVFITLLSSGQVWAQLNVVSSSPRNFSNNLGSGDNIVINFNKALQGASLNADNILLRGSISGTIDGSFSGGGSTSLTFNPSRALIPGEIIFLSLSDRIRANDGDAISSPFHFQFTVENLAPPEDPPVFTENEIAANLSQAGDVITADIDQDGDIDILSPNAFDLSWFENDGNQNFTIRQIASGQFTQYFVLDIDLDGDQDILLSQNGQARYLENDGNQNFTLSDPIASNRTKIFPGDVDGDGDWDLVSVRSFTNEVIWHENDGSQNFTDRSISANADGVRDLWVTDFDLDGDVDILSSSIDDDKISLYVNNGSQVFTEQSVVNSAINPLNLEITDADQDGDPDILLRYDISIFNNQIVLLENQGNLNFTERIIFESNSQFKAFQSNDVDADGALDIVLLNDSDESISILRNLGNFDLQEQLVSLNFGTIITLALSDLDQDGDIDFLATDQTNVSNGRRLVWLENRPEWLIQNFSPARNTINVSRSANIQVTFEKAINPTTLNSDNFLVMGDQSGIISGTLSGGGTSTLTFNPDEDFRFGERIQVLITTQLKAQDGDSLAFPKQYEFRVEVAAAPEKPIVFAENVLDSNADGAIGLFPIDVDQDGDLDLVTAEKFTGGNDDQIAWLENDGSQNFTKRQLSVNADGAEDVTAADLDQDGDIDIFSVSSVDGKVIWFENDGAQNFLERNINIDGNNNPTNIYIRDNEGDGDLDVVLAGTSRIKILINDGNQSFTSLILNISGQDAYPHDIDQDGDLDYLVGNSNSISFLENDGYNNYRNRLIIADPIVTTLKSVLVADLDQDGDVDILTGSNATSNRVAWYENDGRQNFSTRVISINAAGVTQIQVADVDGDGDMDVLSASELDNRIAWYENDGSQNFSERIVSSQVGQAQAVYPNDFDGDGDMDILAASFSDGNFIWYENQAGLTITDFNPIRNAFGVPLDANIQVSFESNVNGASINSNSFRVRGEFSGNIPGSLSGGGSQTITFNPSRDFLAGERIFVSLSTAIQTGNGTSLLKPVDYEFVALSAPSPDDPAYFQLNSIPGNLSNPFPIDIDQDGDLDILTGGRNPIEWYENDGNQNFTQNQIPSNVSGIVYPADIDQDGDIDFLTATASQLAWFENDGSNQFFTQINISTGTNIVDLTVRDLDGDGDFDFFTMGDRALYWYENDGNQNFTQTLLSDQIRFGFNFRLIDTDLDGDLDVLSSDFNSSSRAVVIMENDGNQNFNARIVASNLSGYTDAKDLDQDGDLDIFVTDQNTGRLFLLENTGNQNFNPLDLGDTPTGNLEVIDLDGDNDLDILTQGNFRGQSGVGWLENLGNLEFSQRFVGPGSFIYPADLDRDGDLDFISSSGWYENRDILNLESTSPLANGFADARNANIVLNFDQNIDATTLNSDNLKFYGEQTGFLNGVFSGGGSPTITFDPAQNFKAGEVIKVVITDGLNSTQGEGLRQAYAYEFRAPVSANNGSPTTFQEGLISNAATSAQQSFPIDVDGDGDMDFVAASRDDNKIAWYENNGSESFTERVISTDATLAFGVYAADMDDDGDIDVLSASFEDDKIAWYQNDGNQNFTEVVVDEGFRINGGRAVFATDLDRDGDLDILAAGENNDAIVFFSNNNNFFNTTFISNFSDGVRSIYATDMDQDGDIDVIAASFFGNLIQVFENNGTELFYRWDISTNATGAHSVYAADVDGDGDNDIVAAEFNDNEIVWYENQAHPNNSNGFVFQEHIVKTDAQRARQVYAADVDGDSDMDLLSASEQDNEVIWYINDASQNFQEQLISNQINGATSVFAADIDGDGDADIATAASGDNRLAWQENIQLGLVNNPPNLTDIDINIDEDQPFDFNNTTFTDAYNDVDGSALDSIIIVSLPQQGSLTLNGSPVVINQSIGANQAQNLRYLPNPNFNGGDSFEWNASDGQLFSLTGAMVNFTVAAVNDRPVLSDISLNINKNNVLSFSSSEFNNAFADADGNNPLFIQIVSLPSQGILRLNNNPINPNAEVAIGDISQLTYTPNNNYVGSDGFQWNARDAQSFANAPASINIEVLFFNNPPDLSNIQKAIQEDETLTFSRIDFENAFSDIDADALDSIRISVLPLNGNLFLNGNPLGLNDRIDATELDNFTYVPNPSFAGGDIFSWTASDGFDFSPSSANVEISIAVINDAPVLTNFSVQINEDNTLGFLISNFENSFFDEDGDALDSVRITQLPTDGTLRLLTQVLSINDLIQRNDLDNLNYQPNANYNGNDRFSWTASDGNTFASTPARADITVLAVNDPPSLESFSVPVNSNAAYTFDAALFQGVFSDVDGDALNRILVTRLPLNGVLRLFGSPVSINAQIGVANLSSLTYTPNNGFQGNDSFSWNASDGFDFSPNPANAVLSVSLSNNPPLLNDINISLALNQPYNFQADDFVTAFNDPDGGSLDRVRIILLPVNGNLTFNNNPVNANDEFLLLDLNNLVYTPNNGFSGNDSFVWNGSDGVSFASQNANVILNVSDNTGRPTVVNIDLNVNEDEVLTFSEANFTTAFSDPDGEALVEVQILSLPLQGSLSRSGNPVSINELIPLNEIINLSYTPNLNFNGNDAFNYTASDGNNFATGAVINLSVAAVNDPPLVSAINLNTEQNTAYNFSINDFSNGFSDVDGDLLQILRINILPNNGVLRLNGVDVTINQEISQNQISNLLYLPNNNFTGSDVFSWDASDGLAFSNLSAQVNIEVTAGANNPPSFANISNQIIDEDNPLSLGIIVNDEDVNNVLLSATSGNTNLVPDNNISFSGTGNNRTLLVNPLPDQNGTTLISLRARDAQNQESTISFELQVRAINDPPNILDIDKGVSVNQVLAFTTADFNNAFFDVDQGDLLDRIRIESLPQNGSLSLNGNLVNLNQEINNADLSNLTYTPNQDYQGLDSLRWQASDGGLFATNSARIQINIFSQNSPPALSDISEQINEDETLNFGQNVFNNAFSDPDGDPINVIRIETLPQQGLLLLDGVPLTLQSEVPFNQLPNFTYQANENFNGQDQFNWNASDGFAFAPMAARFSISIIPVNDPPVLNNIDKNIRVNQNLQFSELDFQIAYNDVDGDPLPSINIISLPQNGSLFLDANPVVENSLVELNRLSLLIYTPNPDFQGSDSFIWTANDGQVNANNPALVNINISDQGGNNPPIISFIADQTIEEDNSLQLDFRVGDNEDPSMVQVTALSSNPALISSEGIVISGTGSDRQLNLLPRANQSGTSIITLRAVDQEGESSERSFQLLVQEVDDPPFLAEPISDIQVTENAPASFIDLSAVFSDVDNADNSIIKSIKTLSNANLLEANLSGDVLILSYLPGQVGETEIIIEGQSGAFLIEDAFRVRVNLNPPFNLVANTISQTQIALSWEENSNLEENYVLERAFNSDFDPVESTQVLGIDTLGYLDTLLIPNTTYFYRLSIIAGNDSSAFSNFSAASTLAVPSQPSNLQAQLSGNEVLLQWEDNAVDETGYRLERSSLLTNNNFVEIAIFGPNTNATVNSGLQANLTYTYRVRAINDFGNSIYSNEALVLIPVDSSIAAPPAPNRLRATSITNSQINLSWEGLLDTTSIYVVERSRVPNFINASANEIDTLVTFLNDNFSIDKNFRDTVDLVEGERYYYRVYATNAGGNSAPSNVASALAICNLGNDLLVVQREDGGSGDEAICNGKSAALRVSPLVFNAFYQWRLNGVPIEGANSPSFFANETGLYDCEVRIRDDSTCFGSTLNAQLVVIQGNPLPITISFDGLRFQCSIRDANSYQWYYNFEPIEGATTSTYAPEQNGLYFVVVSFGDNDGACSSTSNLLSFPEVVTGTEDVDLSSQMITQPNPSYGDFIFKIENSLRGPYSLALLDQLGKVYDLGAGTKTANQLELKIKKANLPQGVYYLRLRLDKFEGWKKIILY